MSRFVGWMKRFIGELRRRRVIRVAVVYAGTAFVILQLGEILVDPFDLPGWTLRLVTFLLVLGFPLAIGLAWVYNITEEGLVQTDAEGNRGQIGPGGKPLTSNWILTGLLALIAGLLLYPRVFSSAGTGGGQAVPDTSQIEDRSIAVLPFDPLSGGRKSKTFAQGIHDDLLTRLANISALTVISRTAVQQYRDTELTIGEIADSLGVRWVMEGGVLESGGQIKVNAQLIDPRSEAHVWADDYQRDLTAENLFAIQGEITREIADALKAQLTAGEQSRVTGAPTEDLKAYRLYARGRRQLARRSDEFIKQAVKNFRKAIKRDSTFALGWAGLADAIALSDSTGGRASGSPPFPTGEWGSSSPSQVEAARRALELDPNVAGAHASMGFVHLQNQNGLAALQELKRALSLRPSYWEAHNWLGILYFMLGRPEKALDHAKRAIELNPQHAHARHWLYDAYLATGKAKKSLQAARRQKRLGLETTNAVAGEIRALYHLGRLEEAERLARRELSKLEGGLWRFDMRVHLASVLTAQGDTTGAREMLDWLRSENADPFWMGLVNVALGETRPAFEAFENMKDRYWASLPFNANMRYGLILDLSTLRSDPRYQKLIRELNRKWGLNPDGSIPEDADVSTELKADA